MNIAFIIEVPNKLVNWITFKRKRVVCGKKMKIDGRISIHGHGRIAIGNEVTIHCNPHINPIGGLHSTFLQTIGSGEILIGDNVGISHTAISAATKVMIESNVLIGSGCKIYDTDFHEITYEDRKNRNKDKIQTKPIKICEGAFIGAHSIILKGVTIGKHSVVGAGSVVTKDIPPNQIWAGNPAKFIKVIE